VLLSSGDSFPHLIQKPRSQLGFVTYLLNRPRNIKLRCDLRPLPLDPVFLHHTVMSVLQIFCKNIVLRKIFGPKKEGGRRKLRNEELYIVCS
jgi:hypothetical protein